MKIRCPKCQTSYTLDDALIPESGTVKVQCPSCQARYRVKKKAAPSAQKTPKVEESPQTVDAPATPPVAATPPKDDPLAGVFDSPTNETVDDLFGSSSSSEDDLFGGSDDASPFGTANELPPEHTETPALSDGVDDLFSDESDEPEASQEEVEIPREQEAPQEETPPQDESDSVVDLDNGRIDDVDDLFSDMADNVSGSDSSSDASMSSGLDMKPVEKDSADALFDDIPDDKPDDVPDDKLDDLLDDKPVQDSADLFSNEFAAPANEKTQMMDMSNEESDEQSRTPLPGKQKAHLSSAADIGRGQQQQQSGDALFSDDVSFDMFDKPEGEGGSLFTTHTELPDIKKQGGATITQTPKHRKMNMAMLILKIGVALFLLILLGGGGTYYYIHFYSGKSTDVLKQISESITEQTGTLSDVRLYLMEDSVRGYGKAAGILKQYMKTEDVPASIIGLDAQVQLNMLYSYARRREALEKVAARLEDALAETPDNIDLIKAMAFYNVIIKKYEKAAKLLQPYAKEKDAEVLYILGIAAMKQKLYKEANQFLTTAFISSSGKNTKAGYALALSHYKMGNAKTTIAFLNKIIQKNSGYIKAYVLKAEVLVEKYGKRDSALKLLLSIDLGDLSSLTSRDQAAYYGTLAHLYHMKGETKEAKKQYKKVLELEPRSVLYLLMVANFMKKTGDVSAALQHYETVIGIDAENVEAIIGRAEANALLGQLSKVRNGLFRIHKDKIDDAVLLTRVGNLLTNLGTDVDSVNSLAYFDKAIEVDSSYVEAYLSKIFILLDLNSLDKAREYVALLKKLKVDSFQYHLAQGIINHQDGDYKKATAQFKKAVRLNQTNDSRVFYRYGLLQHDMGKHQLAIKNFRRAVKLSAENYSYRLALGQALFAVKKYKEVVKVLKKEQYKEQKQYKALQLLADSEYRQRHYKEALEYIQRALQLYSKSVRLYYTKATILFAMKDFNAAQKAIDTALLVDMTDADSYLLYAKIFIATGDYKSAMDKINAAERIDDANPVLYLLKGVVAKNLDDYHQALNYFQKISKHPRLQKEAYQEIAECYKALGKQVKSLRYFEKAARQGNSKAVAYLAAIYYDRGDLKKALTYYRRSYAKNKKDPETVKRIAYIYKEREDFVKSLLFFKRYAKLLGDEADPDETDMIEDEIHFLSQNMSTQKFRKMVANPDDYNDDGVSKKTMDKVKKLYMKARSLKKTDPNQAKALFRQVMTLVPKTNRYYKKAFKQFSKIK